MEGLAGSMSKGGSKDIGKMIGVMFMARTASHMSHLKTTSYAKHKALNAFTMH